MIEVLRTNDPIRLDYAVVLLRQAGCEPFVADRFMSAAEGSIPALQRRVMVPDEHETRAREVVARMDDPAELLDDPEDEQGGAP